MEGASKYYSVVTDIGNGLMTAALAGGEKLNITEIAVGDGGGAYYEPTTDMTALKHELWRGYVNSCSVSAGSDNIMIIKGIIPGTVGGFTIREMAVFAESGEMIAIANTPSTPKVGIVDGIINEMTIAIEIALLNGLAINLIVDPNIVTATKADIDALIKLINNNGRVLIGTRDTPTKPNDIVLIVSGGDIGDLFPVGAAPDGAPISMIQQPELVDGSLVPSAAETPVPVEGGVSDGQ